MIPTLIIATYLLFSATVGIAVFLFAGPSIGFLAGAVLALGCVQVHSNYRNRRARRITEREIAIMKRARFRFEQALDEVRAKIDDIGKALEFRTATQNRKIVNELQVLESLMRAFSARVSENSRDEPIVTAAVPPRRSGSTLSFPESPGERHLLETIRASLEQNRVDLYLQPIVSLPQRKLRFYEALSHLRAEDGSVIMPAQYIKLAEPAGLMPVVDNLLLFRCVQIVRRLTQKQRDIGIFCNISGDSLADAEFFPQFLEFLHHNRDLAGQIVFEFAQDEVLRSDTEAEANLAYLANLGFALSLDHVETLEFDFTKLKKLGFRYIKVRTGTLTRGMGNVNAALAGSDLKKRLERHGLDLIAERVEDEQTVTQLLDLGVDYAQGYLFGRPRAVRDDSLRAMEKEGAAAPIIPFRKAG